ncbi:hypothetical protein [Patiriisocius sp. Uisw_017]|uniref:hypothetical protein n=1 Tax=Patiriisocius sp. Uisw_017 TaxID=3230968 RepID=UPI0039EA1534
MSFISTNRAAMKKFYFLFLILTTASVYSQTDCPLTIQEWDLKEISINSEIFQPNANDEVINVILECPNNSNSQFITTFCRTGIGVVEQSSDGFSFVNQEFIIS